MSTMNVNEYVRHIGQRVEQLKKEEALRAQRGMRCYGYEEFDAKVLESVESDYNCCAVHIAVPHTATRHMVVTLLGDLVPGEHFVDFSMKGHPPGGMVASVTTIYEMPTPVTGLSLAEPCKFVLNGTCRVKVKVGAPFVTGFSFALVAVSSTATMNIAGRNWQGSAPRASKCPRIIVPNPFETVGILWSMKPRM